MQNYKKRCSIIVITWGIQVFVKTDMIGGLTGPLYSLNQDFKKTLELLCNLLFNRASILDDIIHIHFKAHLDDSEVNACII